MWPRRLTALLALVLQVGVVLAPLGERGARQTVTHAEQRGTRHARMHNESTCALCAAGSLQTAMAAPPPPPVLLELPAQVARIALQVPASRDPPSANTTRAPPRLG